MPDPAATPAVRTRRWTRVLRRYTLLIAATYFGCLVALVFAEPYLVFPGARNGVWNRDDIRFEAVDIQTADGTRLGAFYLPVDTDSPPQAAMLIHHGNGENISHWLDEAHVFRKKFQLPVLIYDYRGYGRSEGFPSEEGILQDASAASEYLAERTGLPPANIIQFGRSLGGAPAVYLAARDGALGLILDRTFNSVAAVAADRYWMFPVDWIIRNRFDSAQRIDRYEGPLLQMHGGADEIIPIRFARRLFAAADSQNKTFIESPETFHNDRMPSEFLQAMERFIGEISPASDIAAGGETPLGLQPNPAQ